MSFADQLKDYFESKFGDVEDVVSASEISFRASDLVTGSAAMALASMSVYRGIDLSWRCRKLCDPNFQLVLQTNGTG